MQATSNEVDLRGRFEGFSGVFATGWASWGEGCEDHARVVVHIDGQTIAQSIANCHFPYLGNGPEAHTGFRIPLPGRFFSGAAHKVEVFAVQEDGVLAPLPGGPYFLGKDQFDGFFDYIKDGAAEGWCCPRSFTDPCRVDLYVDGVPSGSATADHPRADLASTGIHIRNSAYSIPLPPICVDGRPHTIEVRCNGVPLHGSPRTYQADYRGFIDSVDFHKISGWIINKTPGSGPVKLDVSANEKTFTVLADGVRTDLFDEYGSTRHGFHLDISRENLGSDVLSIAVKLHGVDVPLTKAPLTFYSARGLDSMKARFIDAIMGTCPSVPGSGGVDLSILHSSLHNLPAILGVPRESYWNDDQTIYGPERQLHVLETVHSPTRGMPVTMAVLVDEKTADAIDFGAFLASLKAFTLPGLDVAVVRTGTVGTEINDFIKRLYEAGVPCLAESAFVRLFMQAPAAFVEGRGEKSLRGLMIVPADSVPSPEAVRVWCRQFEAHPALTSLSLLTLSDAQAFAPKGRGPKAAAAIRRNLGIDLEAGPAVTAAAQPRLAFLKAPRTAFTLLRSAPLLDAAPAEDEDELSLADFLDLWLGTLSDSENLHGLSDAVCVPSGVPALRKTDFLSSKDHALCRSMAEAVAVDLLLRDGRPTVLHVMHNLDGGILRHCRDVAEMLEEAGVRSLFFRPVHGGLADLYDPVSGLGRRVAFSETEDGLTEVARNLNIRSVHIHHVINHVDAVWKIAERLGVPYDVTIHDYYWVCPRVTLIDDSGQYCGEPSASSCNRCVAMSGCYDNVQDSYDELGGTVSAWRRHHGALLAGARTVLVPSGDVLERMKRYVPEANLHVLTHAEAVPSTVHVRRGAASSRIGVAVIGGIGPHKGFEHLIRLARWSDRRNLNLHFYVVGTVPDTSKFDGLGNITFTGGYKQAELPERLAALDCQLALFLSVWPETYCYTLSEALAAGLTPVSYDLGAVGERLRALGVGTHIPFPSTPEIIVRALMETYAWRSTLAAPVSIDIGLSPAQYTDAYLTLIDLCERSHARAAQ